MYINKRRWSAFDRRLSAASGINSEEKKIRYRTRPISGQDLNPRRRKSARTKIVNQCLTLLPRPGRVQPFAPAAYLSTQPPTPSALPPEVASIARRRWGTHSQRVANYYSRYTSHRFVVHRQRRLLFIVHHIAVPVTTRSYNTTTGRIRRARRCFA